MWFTAYSWFEQDFNLIVRWMDTRSYKATMSKHYGE